MSKPTGSRSLPEALRERSHVAFVHFRELVEDALDEGAALRDYYHRRRDDFWERATEIQLRWLRSRHDLVLDGLLLPGSRFAFGLARALSEFEHGPVGTEFDRACRELEDYWYAGLGVSGWDWQQGTPPGWDEHAARAPRLRPTEAGTW